MENNMLDAGGKEAESRRLWVKTGNIESQDHIDSEANSTSESIPSTPDTPACKGYLIESDFVEMFLGECCYFVAPIQPAGFAIFGLSPERRMVSLVDENSSFHHYHSDQSFGPNVYFTIGDLWYQWDTQHGILSTPASNQIEAGPSHGSNLSVVHLYKDLEAAKAFLDSLQYFNLPTLANLSLGSPPLTDSHASSPPNVAETPPIFTGSHLFDSSPGRGYFGPSPSQEKIDRWVDNSVKADQGVRDGVHLKCPEVGCNASSRRPHALKTHLYTHYRIKPYTCRMCDISVLTEANLVRHIKNVEFLFGKCLNPSIFDNATTKAKQDGKQVLQLKTDNSEVQWNPENTCSPSASTPIYTPMCKGYTFGLNFAGEFLGECYYFIAQVKPPSGSTEFSIFSLSPERKIVSLVDAELSFHHYPIERTVGPTVYFMIGDSSYRWDTQRNALLTLPSEKLGADPSVPRSSSARVQLYSSLEDAKALLDSLSFDELSMTLGKRHYFVAPFELDQGLLGFAVFSLSPDCRTVSFVDTNSCYHLHHVDLSFSTATQFTIGMLQYEWDIQNDILSTLLPDILGVDSSDLAPKLSSVQLYASLEEAKSYVDLLRFDELVIQEDHDLGASSSASTSRDTSTSPRPEVTSTPSTSNGAGPSSSPFGSGFFGSSPSQEDVDRWVDQAVKNHQSTGDGTYLTCPESRCGHTSRRPHALKTHIYTHYRIKPHMCTMCGISVLTEANRRRHMKNIHNIVESTRSGGSLAGITSAIKVHNTSGARTSSVGPARNNLRTRTAPYPT